MPVDPDLRIPELEFEQSVTLLLGQTELVLQSGPEAVSGPANLLENTAIRTLQRSTYRIEYGSAAIGEILAGAGQLDSLPAALRAADCTFGRWRITQCTLSYEVNTL